MKARKSPHHLSQTGHNRGATSCPGWTRLMGIVISSESDHASSFDHSHIQNAPVFFCSWAFIQHLTVVGTLLHLFTTSQKRPSLIKPSNQKPSCCNTHHKHQSGGSSCFTLPAPDTVCADFPSVTIISIYSLKHILWLKPLRTHSLTTADLINTSCWSEWKFHFVTEGKNIVLSHKSRNAMHENSMRHNAFDTKLKCLWRSAI